MSEQHFETAPSLGAEFNHSNKDIHEQPLEHDAERWEPAEEYEIEGPSEKHLEMHLTPGGILEQEVHSELDEAARQRIGAAQRSQFRNLELADEAELDFASDFDEASAGKDSKRYQTRKWETPGQGKDWGDRSVSRDHDNYEH